MESAKLAKLGPPRLFNAFARERLFVLLDAARKRPALWIEGPPGAGKSTLVASYLAARGLPALWYHVDEGDRDPATFFYYLGQAAAPFARRQRTELPLLAGEFLANVPGFSRRCFQTLFALLPTPAVVVFDNYEDIDAASVMQVLIEEAVEQIPHGVNVLIVSRSAPLVQFSALIAKQRMGVLAADALRLTPQEGRGLARALGCSDETLSDRVQALMGGWAAGSVLALDRLGRVGGDPEAIELDSREAAFDYFAGEVFERAPADVQQVLLATAFLPSMTVDLAERVSAARGAGRVLKDLYRRHLFVERRTAAVHVYRYHALFQEFLRERACETLAPQALALSIGNTARALQGSGLFDEALELFLQAGAWDSAIELLLAQAAGRLQQGRGQTLRQQVDALPPDAVHANPWLAYWYAASLTATQPAEALRRMADTFDQFRDRRDLLGQVFAAAGAIESCIVEFSAFEALDRWIAELDALLEDEPAFGSNSQALRVYTSATMAAVMRQPGHPLLRARLDKLWSLLGAATDADERVNAAQWILAAAAQRGSFDDVPRAVAIVEPVLDEPRLSPLLRAHWYRRLGYVLYLQGEYEAALAWLQKGQAIARQHEFHGALALGLYGLTLAAVALGDVERAQAELLLFEAAGPPLRNAELAVWHHARSLVALHKGDFDAAFAGARAAAAAAIETGWPHMATLRHLQLAFMHAEVGEHAAATAEVQRTQQLIAGTPLQFYDCGLALVQAYIALKQQDLPLCHALLARALAQARATGYVFITRFLPDALPRLFEQALAAGIEPDYTREVIKRLRVLPAAGAGASWPWPLKILTLGSFEVWTDDTRLVFRRKAQKKPMDLLKALIAMGGRGVEASRLAEALWPDSDGDVAHKALETTLYRMRKLVRHDGLVHLGDGKLSLDARRVWIDTWAFQQALQPGPSSAARASPAATQQLLALYRADFLAAEPEEPWMLPLRLRLRDQWLGWLRDQGHELERRGEPGAAEALYRRGLEIDPSDENLYRRLMTSQRDRGDLAEAARTYRRCTEVLANLLGTRPCEATEAIRRSLAPSAAQPR